MKRLFFTVSLTALLFGFSSFASGKKFPDVLSSFYQTFKNAQNVNWTEVDDMLRIGFTLNGRQQFAYYSNDDLIVVAAEIKVDELPASLKQQLSAYEAYTVSQVYELTRNEVKEYCLVIDSPSKHIILKGKKVWAVYLQDRK